jgi:2-(1,2-epoxy-1,2-dihydrophenyl)acetyl-CoA isomerase
VTTRELETVALRLDSGIATIVLNRPETLNAWTRQLGDDMLAALEHAAAAPEVRVVVFTGARNDQADDQRAAVRRAG